MLTHNIRECDPLPQRHMSPPSRRTAGEGAYVVATSSQCNICPPWVASQTSVRGMLTILGLTNPWGACYTTYRLNSLPAASQLCMQCRVAAHLGSRQGVNRGILPPYATLPPCPPSHTQMGRHLPTNQQIKVTFGPKIYPGRDILVYFGDMYPQ